MNPTTKKIILFAVIIASIVVISVTIFGKKDENADLFENTAVVNTTSSPEKVQSQKFLQSLNQVNSINLDTTLFNSKAYQKLVDFSVPIVLEDQRLIGRPNPFAPLGVDAIINQPNKSQIDILNQDGVLIDNTSQTGGGNTGLNKKK